MHNVRIRKLFLTALVFSVSIVFAQNGKDGIGNSQIDLKGKWQFKLDPDKKGIEQKWFEINFEDNVNLPGSLDGNKKGLLNNDTSEFHLNRIRIYEGPAWFKKEIEIPKDWNGKNIFLELERTKVTKVWIDTFYIGTKNMIFSPQVYDLSGKLNPGKHTLTIIVDNTADLVPVAGSHAYSEDTQTNWNGIIGKILLQAKNQVRIADVRIFPDIKTNRVKVNMRITGNDPELKNISVGIEADLWNTKKTQSIPQKKYDVNLKAGNNNLSFDFDLANNAKTWSEFEPALYKLNISLMNKGNLIDSGIFNFGLREFKTTGTQFTINGLTTFLRGKHDACVFPLTGYPPTDVESWIKVLKIAKSYGINFYRFHTWCPPKAAFEAADIVGIYMHPELPIWWAFKPEDPDYVNFMMKEGKSILDNYANHPSFVMFAMGNEIWNGRDTLKKMVAEFRAYDNRPLYAQGSNNSLGDPSYAEGDDYWTTFRTAKEKADFSSDARMSLSFLDSKIGDAGVINSLYPSTTFTFSKAMEYSPVPVIGHETGQYSIYPDYNEMKKYTGILKPWNFGIFKKRLEEKGMMDEADKFFKASGALSAICYKEEIEAAVRTPGFGGFELLDLQDYPGQGTALVGVLDAFMETKGLITPQKYREFCNDIVLLLEMDKYCWTNGETFLGELKLANYSSTDLNNKIVDWELFDGNTAVNSGKIKTAFFKQGSLNSIGNIEIPLSQFDHAKRLDVKISMDNGQIKNEYPIWVYPSRNKIDVPANIFVAHELNEDVENNLRSGGSVLLFPDTSAIKKNSVGGQFIPEFWNYGMFTSLAKQYGGRISEGTMGILTDPANKIFNSFPTEFHSNWQWWPIVKNSNPVILDETKKEYRPIVQVIDNINRNHKLGLIFEFKVGQGKVLVCASQLPEIQKPEAKQLYNSLISYMISDNFNPAEEISFEELKDIL